VLSRALGDGHFFGCIGLDERMTLLQIVRGSMGVERRFAGYNANRTAIPHH
jgi:hypothetical protein